MSSAATPPPKTPKTNHIGLEVLFTEDFVTQLPKIVCLVFVD